MKLFTKCFSVFLFLSLFQLDADAQKRAVEDIARDYIQNNYGLWGLSDADVADMELQNHYQSDHNGVTHLYFMQRYAGTEIYNAVLNVHVTKSGKAFSLGNPLQKEVASRVNALDEVLSPADAIRAAGLYLGVSGDAVKDLAVKEKKGPKDFVFGKGNASKSDIPVKLCYQPYGNQLRLAWNLAIDMVDNSDYWSVRVDALTGKILSQNNYTVHCSVEKGAFANQDVECKAGHTHTAATSPATAAAAAGSYRVFALPAESPIHGPHVLVTDPHDPNASPFGWHDVNGAAGAEFTITRGNNVHAYLDLNNSNNSRGDEPDGGQGLVFDFPFDPNLEPSEMRDAAVTNLFYMNNMIHDFAYSYGFNESAGNFQQNNYGKGGTGNDYVEAQAQDGGGTNNANFGTPPDGGNGRMQMYLWGGGGGLLRVDEPAEIAGWYETGTASFGLDVTPDVNISGEIVEVNDGVFNPYVTDGCEAFPNPDAVAGKIALVDRGGCFFQQKTVYAEDAGAIAVIICNYAEDAMGMAGAGNLRNPSIPTISLGNSDCKTIRQYLSNGVQATITVQQSNGPTEVDGDFDNGIIAHEFAHGISNRLTGGPGQAGCLGNEEQMGEGWSDFFSLVTTVQAGDFAEMRRGIGTYAQRQTTDGRGIRPYPYSTDMNINPLTYKDISQLSIPHGLGSVWCTMLWDLYWAFVDVYGFDDDLANGSGGNNMAVQLVMDGMKYQVCNPGFIDGRDAILAADEILYDGVNQCLIWEVFARRGLGIYAQQGDSDNAADGVENFEPLPTCIQELKIKKAVTPLVDAGDEIEVTLTITNHKLEAVTNLSITDELPDGLTFLQVFNTTGIPKDQIEADDSNPNAVTFTLNNGSGGLASLEEITITYKALTNPDKYSARLYFDDIPDNSLSTELKWLIGIESDQSVSSNIWQISDLEAYSGDYAWNVDDHWLDTRQVLELADPLTVSGRNPVLRFFHKIESFPGRHGGVIEVSNDGGGSFQSVSDLFFRNGYTGQIIYQAFTIPNFPAFFGKSDDFIGSYVDLNDFKGEDLRIRFRFGTQDTTEFSSEFNPAYTNYFNNNLGGTGWTIDNFELMDLFHYNGEVCVTSGEGEKVCAIAPNKGTVVESQILSSTKELGSKGTVFSVFPNPASETMHIAINAQENMQADISMFSIDGKLVYQQNRAVYKGEQVFGFPVGGFQEGLYFIRIQSDDAVITEKVFIK